MKIIWKYINIKYPLVTWLVKFINKILRNIWQSTCFSLGILASDLKMSWRRLSDISHLINILIHIIWKCIKTLTKWHDYVIEKIKRIKDKTWHLQLKFFVDVSHDIPIKSGCLLYQRKLNFANYIGERKWIYFWKTAY